MIALGTHQPMSEEAILERLEISAANARRSTARFASSTTSGHPRHSKGRHLSLADTRELTGGLFEMEVPVTINAKIFEYDQIVIIGPCFRMKSSDSRWQQVLFPA